MKRVYLITIMMVLTLMLTGSAQAAPDIEEATMEYSAKGVVMKGYLAYDKNITGRRPGVVVVHEWWGLNDFARKRARTLAELGYAALAVDMYGEGKLADHPDTAGKFSSELMKNFDTAKDRFIAALEFLKAQSAVDQDKIAAIGYCFGGGVVLNMARQGVDLQGVASFHGSLSAVKPAERGSVKAKILVLHGADDTFITKEQIAAFRNEMEKAGADFRFIAYPGALHSFTNPDADEYGRKCTIPVAYNAEADKKSWEELKTFLKKIFNQ